MKQRLQAGALFGHELLHHHAVLKGLRGDAGGLREAAPWVLGSKTRARGGQRQVQRGDALAPVRCCVLHLAADDVREVVNQDLRSQVGELLAAECLREGRGGEGTGQGRRISRGRRRGEGNPVGRRKERERRRRDRKGGEGETEATPRAKGGDGGGRRERRCTSAIMFVSSSVLDAFLSLSCVIVLRTAGDRRQAERLHFEEFDVTKDRRGGEGMVTRLELVLGAGCFDGHLP